MRSYQLMIDATADLGKDMRDRYNIDQMCLCQSFIARTCVSHECVCPNTEEGEDLFSDANMERMLRASFIRYAKEDIDVLYLAPSSALLPLFEKAVDMAKSVMTQYPTVKIAVADTGVFGIGQGALALSLAKLRERGEDIDTALSVLEEQKTLLSQFSTLDKPPAIGPFGRRQNPTLTLGRLLGLRPVFELDEKGSATVRARANSLQNAILNCAKQAKRRLGDKTPLFISYVRECEEIKMAKSAFGEDVYFCQMSPFTQKWFGQDGCSIAGILPTQKKAADQDEKNE